MTDSSLNSHFKSIALSSFPKPPAGSILSLPSTASLADAIDFLTEHNILACPVQDVAAEEDAHWTTKYIGSVSVTDIMLATFDHLERSSDDGKASPLQLRRQLAHKAYYKTTPVSTCVKRVGSLPFLALKEEDDRSLLDVMLLLGKYASHRVFVVNAAGHLTNIITQSAVVRSVGAMTTLPAAFLDQTVEATGLWKPAKTVFSVSVSDTAREAFKLIRDKNVTAVPVVTDDGKIMGIVSSKDIRVAIKSASALSTPVRTFLSDIAMRRTGTDTSSASVTVTQSTEVRRVIDLLNTTRLHRVVCVDGEDVPIGVVALRDVIACLASPPSVEYFEDIVAAATGSGGGGGGGGAGAGAGGSA